MGGVDADVEGLVEGGAGVGFGRDSLFGFDGAVVEGVAGAEDGGGAGGFALGGDGGLEGETVGEGVAAAGGAEAEEEFIGKEGEKDDRHEEEDVGVVIDQVHSGDCEEEGTGGADERGPAGEAGEGFRDVALGHGRFRGESRQKAGLVVTSGLGNGSRVGEHQEEGGRDEQGGEDEARL